MDTMESMKLVKISLFRAEITLTCFNINKVVTHLRDYPREKEEKLNKKNQACFI